MILKPQWSPSIEAIRIGPAGQVVIALLLSSVKGIIGQSLAQVVPNVRRRHHPAGDTPYRYDIAINSALVTSLPCPAGAEF